MHKRIRRRTSLEQSSFRQEWLWLLQNNKLSWIRHVGRPFPTGGGSGKSLTLKTASANSEKADLAYLVGVIDCFFFSGGFKRSRPLKTSAVSDLFWASSIYIGCCMRVVYGGSVNDPMIYKKSVDIKLWKSKTTQT